VVREAERLREQRIAAYGARRAEEAATAAADPWREAGNDAQADRAPAPGGVESLGASRGAQPPPRSPEPGGHESWASAATRLDAEADPDPAVDPGYKPGPPDRSDPGPDPAPDHVAEMRAEMKAMSARVQQIEAERAEREAADDYYVHSSRQAEANAEAAAEPSPTPSDVDVDVELDMEPG